LRDLLGAVSILHESLDLETLPQRTTAAVTRVLPRDMVTYNEVDLVRRTDRIFVAPEDARLAAGTLEYATFIRHINEHPVISHNARVADPVPRKISDFPLLGNCGRRGCRRNSSAPSTSITRCRWSFSTPASK
jgi:hypothetical protein